MSNLQNKLTFFRDCLEAEGRAQTMWNVRTAKNESIKRIEPQTVLNNLNGIVVEQSYALSLAKILDRYWREKQLMVGMFFIVAYDDVAGFGARKRKRKICCPLIYFPCELSKRKYSGVPKVLLNLDRGVVNPAVQQFLRQYDIDVDEKLDRLLKVIKQGNIQDDANESSIGIDGRGVQGAYDIASEINSILSESRDRPGFDFRSAFSPKLTTASCLKKIKHNEVFVVDESLLYISRKQGSAQSSLFEIEEIIKSNNASSALSAIVDKHNVKQESYNHSFWNWLPWRRYEGLDLPLPVVLSDAQTSVISNSAEHTLSVVVGPPGTGKSFTIASLALKEFTRGKSVLVVSQNQHAVDVVRRKLVDDFGVDSGLTVLGNDNGLSREVKAQLELLRSKTLDDSSNDYKTLSGYKELIDKLNDKLEDRNNLEAQFLASCQRKSNGNQEVKQSDFFSWLRKKPVEHSERLLSEQFFDLETLDDEISVLTAKLVNLHYNRKVYKLFQNEGSRVSIDNFIKSLTARNAYYQEKYYSLVNFSDVLSAVPFWFAPLSCLSRLLPLEKELFDVVIIDEATQCNLSVCIPALYRAKRAVVVGDPKQLSHVSFVSYDVQQTLFDRYSLNPNDLNPDFRNNSVLDYAMASTNSVAQLDEHFRSHSQIIEFSNQTFYNNTLKVMTTRPNRIRKAIELRRVDGKRSKGVNLVEANALIDEVKEMVEAQLELPQSEVQSIGILSFFSDQAKHIEKILFNDLSLNALRRHNLRVGTPFSFQGEERDHMLISCCIDADTAGGSYTYLNRDDVFNVAITRARDYQTIFISCDFEEIKSNSKLKSYIKYCYESADNNLQTQELERDSFQDEIYTWLQSKGIKAYKNYVVAGTAIDLMAVYEDRALAIDLIGFDGSLSGSLSLKKFKLLARAGLSSFLLAYDEWRNDKEQLFENLLLQIGALTKLDRQDKPGVAVFRDVEENFIHKLTGGISINQLNDRFIRSGELRAAKQIPIILEKRVRFERLLHLCFIPEELTFKRYKNAFHNLIKDCIVKLQQSSISAELTSSLLEQQKQFFGEENQYGDEYNDIFDARASMVEEQRNKIQQLLDINESALLQMDKTCLKLNALYESVDDSELNSHDILDELTEKIDLYQGVTLDKNQENN